jgi:hypothetical protein
MINALIRIDYYFLISKMLTGPESPSFKVKGRELDINLSILKIDIASLLLVPLIHGSSLSFYTVFVLSIIFNRAGKGQQFITQISALII